MAGICDICGKHPMMGHNIRLQARTSKWFRRAPKSPKRFKPNIQRTTMTINGVHRQFNVCTRCIRTASKQS